MPCYCVLLQICPLQPTKLSRHPAKEDRAMKYLAGSLGKNQPHSRVSPALERKEDNHTHLCTLSVQQLNLIAGTEKRVSCQSVQLKPQQMG